MPGRSERRAASPPRTKCQTSALLPVSRPSPEALKARFQRLTARVTFAAVNPNKALKILADFPCKADGISIRMVNGGLMAKPPRNCFYPAINHEPGKVCPA